jgi:tripartite-type tricarboxylate transporter receptor subunit TctC
VKVKISSSILGRPGICTILSLAIAAGLSVSAAFAQTGAWAGKTITLLVGQPAGGGYDGYSRLFAQYLPAFLPGKPRIIVENMPGAGGVTMADYLAAEAPKDGTAIGLASGAIGTAELFHIPGVRFDPRKIGWIGSMDSEIGEAISWSSSPIKTAQDLFSRELVVAGTGAASNSVIFPRAMNKVLGAKFKIIPGYHGSGEMALALERGEVQGIGSDNYSDILQTHPAWITDHKINFLMQLSLKRHPALPLVPTALDLAHTDEQRQLLQVILAQQTIGRPIFAPPGLPDDKLQMLQSAFRSVMSDPGFQQAARIGNVQLIDPLDGPAVRKFIGQLYDFSPEIRDKAAASLSGGN